MNNCRSAGNENAETRRTQSGKAPTRVITAEHAEYAERKPARLGVPRIPRVPRFLLSVRLLRSLRAKWTVALQRGLYLHSLRSLREAFHGLRPSLATVFQLRSPCTDWSAEWATGTPNGIAAKTRKRRKNLGFRVSCAFSRLSGLCPILPTPFQAAPYLRSSACPWFW